MRLLRARALRAADALQLAAALVAADGHSRVVDGRSLDERLALAAEREGLRLALPAACLIAVGSRAAPRPL